MAEGLFDVNVIGALGRRLAAFSGVAVMGADGPSTAGFLIDQAAGGALLAGFGAKEASAFRPPSSIRPMRRGDPAILSP